MYKDNIKSSIQRDTTDEDTTENLPSDLTTEEKIEMLLNAAKAEVGQNQAEPEALSTGSKKVVLYGDEAVAKVREMEGGRELSEAEELVIREEGFVNAVYKDTKGISTYGVGQTGKYMKMSFGKVFKMHEDAARNYIPKYDDLSEKVKAAIMSAMYRGDLGQSPMFRKLFNTGKYKEAAKEFLDNDDYRESILTGDGVAGRLERIASAVLEGEETGLA